MKAYRATFPLAAMCRVLGLPSSRYYGRLRRMSRAVVSERCDARGCVFLGQGPRTGIEGEEQLTPPLAQLNHGSRAPVTTAGEP